MQTRGRSGWEVAGQGGPEFRALVLHEKIYANTHVNLLRPISSGGCQELRGLLGSAPHPQLTLAGVVTVLIIAPKRDLKPF